MINGKLEDVLLFLDDLSAGSASTPSIEETRETWQRAFDRYRKDYLGQFSRDEEE